MPFHHDISALERDDHELKSLKLWAKINLSSFNFFLSGILVQRQNIDEHTKSYPQNNKICLLSAYDVPDTMLRPLHALSYLIPQWH